MLRRLEIRVGHTTGSVDTSGTRTHLPHPAIATTINGPVSSPQFPGQLQAHNQTEWTNIVYEYRFRNYLSATTNHMISTLTPTCPPTSTKTPPAYHSPSLSRAPHSSPPTSTLPNTSPPCETATRASRTCAKNCATWTNCSAGSCWTLSTRTTRISSRSGMRCKAARRRQKKSGWACWRFIGMCRLSGIRSRRGVQR